ncbi:MAG: UDP-glucose 4-epimerase [Candidatus Omnitrophica bacterium]|nr:UDP-glucose 4-epimerase [Candidatus Omnitrophota bacterium]
MISGTAALYSNNASGLTASYAPTIVRGINVYPDNPLKFDFIIDKGQSKLGPTAFEQESQKLIRYFLASVTIPQKDMWVNLSPTEPDRIIPQIFGQTEMGRDLLTQDYLLKQLTAALLRPDSEVGAKFWDAVYSKIYEERKDRSSNNFDIPADILSKIWIVPDTAQLSEHDKGVDIVNTHLKVMTENEYFNDQSSPVYPLSSLIKQIILPAIEKEVNEGQTFSNLRQIYNSMILAKWYKARLKQSLLGQVYANKNKINGVRIKDRIQINDIYNKYLEIFKLSVNETIKEEYDPEAGKIVARKYLSGGYAGQNADYAMVDETDPSKEQPAIDPVKVTVELFGQMNPSSDNRQLLKAAGHLLDAEHARLDQSNYWKARLMQILDISLPPNFDCELNHPNAVNMSDSDIYEKIKRYGTFIKIFMEKIPYYKLVAVIFTKDWQLKFIEKSNDNNLDETTYYFTDDGRLETEVASVKDIGILDFLQLDPRISQYLTSSNVNPMIHNGKTVLLTGAGYIGSAIISTYLQYGTQVIIYDRNPYKSEYLSLVANHKNVIIVRGDLNDPDRLRSEVMDKYHIDLVVHLAGVTSPRESMNYPEKYFHENILGTMNLLHAMSKYQIKHFIFASTADVYGGNEEMFDERDETYPGNPYSESKWLLEIMAEYFSKQYGFNYVAFRIFNAAGAFFDNPLHSDDGQYFGEINRTSLLARAIESQLRPQEVTLTIMGKPVRDFIHIKDIANACLKASAYLYVGEENLTLNLGTGRKTSVPDVIDMLKKIFIENGRVWHEITQGPAVAGSVQQSTADFSKAFNKIGWWPEYSLTSILRTAVLFHFQQFIRGDHPVNANESVSDNILPQPEIFAKKVYDQVGKDTEMVNSFKFEILFRLLVDVLTALPDKDRRRNALLKNASDIKAQTGNAIDAIADKKAGQRFWEKFGEYILSYWDLDPIYQQIFLELNALMKKEKGFNIDTLKYFPNSKQDDNALLTKGGIDFNSDHVVLSVNQADGKFDFKIDPVLMEQYQHVEILQIKILQILPMKNLTD